MKIQAKLNFFSFRVKLEGQFWEGIIDPLGSERKDIETGIGQKQIGMGN